MMIKDGLLRVLGVIVFLMRSIAFPTDPSLMKALVDLSHN